MCNNLDVDDIIFRLLQARNEVPMKFVPLKYEEIQSLCVIAKDIFLAQPMLLEIKPPLSICGDIHGHYVELLRVFDQAGYPPLQNYLFLGNYVDKGKYSIEVICLLLAYKIKYPDMIYLLRGNHECERISKTNGFYDECIRRYNIKAWKNVINCFHCLPVAAIVGERIFCCHGGLSPDLDSMEQIKNLPRPCSIPEIGLLYDLLWSNPSVNINCWTGEMKDKRLTYCFGFTVINEFLNKYDFDVIVRSLQFLEFGFEHLFNRQLVTIFSAADFCGQNNYGAVLSVNADLLCSIIIITPKHLV